MPNVEILSHFTGELWVGEADVDLDSIFRFFNRVDGPDGDRLEKIGYVLPSLSVNDMCAIDGQHYIVASAGFHKVNDRQSLIYMMDVMRGCEKDVPLGRVQVIDGALHYRMPQGWIKRVPEHGETERVS